MSPRPRSRDKVVPMSIGIPLSLMMRLDNELEWKQSRSKWVQKAILAKLDAHDNRSQIIDEMSSQRLCAILLNRQVITPGMFEILQKEIKAGSRFGEIEE